jgi:hypothetical protein
MQGISAYNSFYDRKCLRTQYGGPESNSRLRREKFPVPLKSTGIYSDDQQCAN